MTGEKEVARRENEWLVSENERVGSEEACLCFRQTHAAHAAITM